MKIAARLGQDIKQEMEGGGRGGRKTMEEGGMGRRQRLAAAAVTPVNAA